MMEGDKNSKSQLKDSSSLPTVYNKDALYSVFHNRTNKLVTALYMVTDIMDKDEPLRLKLRNLGTSIISDMYIVSSNTSNKIDEILSFLNIASSISMISPMNHSILQKEFNELKQAIEDSKHKSIFFGDDETMANFLKRGTPEDKKELNIGQERNYKKYTRIGVQKGGTLMKALSDRITVMSDINNRVDSSVLKSERRQEIEKIIKEKTSSNIGNFNGLTITDIRNMSVRVLQTCSEKTLQRELVSMVKDGLLKKVGDKRWSRYFLSSSTGSVPTS